MVDRLDIALRRYEHIRRAAAAGRCGAGGLELSVWLEQDVCPVVEELSGRPDFQVPARWPLDRLQPGAASGERNLVNKVDAGLVECARALVILAREPAVWTALLQLTWAGRRVVARGRHQRAKSSHTGTGRGGLPPGPARGGRDRQPPLA